MAANDTIGLNIELPIYNADGTAFHNLVLHKSTYDSIVMSLSDKITGDVYYPNNQLSVTMQEYVELDGVKFVLVNPPTVVKEGMVSDNSQLNGMTKYSFVFYHPMYMLNNFPFRDVAVTSDQTKYLSESKKFSWIGYPDDFIAKLNKNLVGTEWIVEKSDRFPEYLDDQLSEVLPFDDNTIGEALKVGYDTWGTPYVIGKVASTEASYASGKRFKVIFGLPSNEIYEDASHQQLNEPFVFQFGQGVGLKNNSRTPRNNKIITRISGCGSENNIPYGYPQIPWYGDSRWDWTEYEGDTINYDADGKVTNTPKTTAYPLYMGILGGAYVKLIKHPFTRTNLMPSIYSQTLFNKVSPYNSDGTANENYNPNTTLIDYYDAIATQEYPYPNPIVASAPSYESHQFDDIKPELGTDIAIVDAWPINDADLQPASSWDDSIDDDGNYKQGYFKMTLPVLTFDLYACAAITEEMQINMRGGACLGCTFTVQVDWDDYKNNFYDSDGNFAPTGSQRDYTKYPDTTQEQVTIILQKETSTFGTLMPNMYQHPVTGDTFVVLGISLPLSYITNAEVRLDGEMKSYMLENNVHYFDYPLKFDEAFLRNHSYILQQIKPNSVIRFKYGNDTLQLFVKQLTVKYGEKVLPQYDITLTDNVEVVLNQIGRVADDVEKLSALIAAVRQNYSRSVWAELEKKLSKTQDDTAQGFIRMLKGLQVGNQFVSGLLGEGGVFRKEADGTTYLEADKMYIRMKAYFDTVEIREYQHTAGNRIASVAGNKCVRVAWFNSSNVELEQTQANLSSVAYFRCFFRASDGEDTVRNNFVIGDQVYCHITSVAGANDNPNEKGLNQKHYWRLCIGRNVEGTLTDDGEAWIDVSNRSSETLTIGGTQYTHAGYQTGSDVPEPQDSMVQLGNINDVTRQGAIIEFVTGADAPSYQIYQGINAFDLTNKNQISIGYNSATGHAKMDVFGDAYIGDRNRSTYIEYKQNGTNNQPELNIKARVQFTNTQEMSQFVKDNQNNYDDSELQQAVSDLNDVTDNLQSQIDGAIETIYGDVDPTEEGNDPYEDYTTAEKEKHIGDMYYDTVSGYAYRYDKTVEEGVTTYHWTLITDSGITEAIAKAGEALGVANTKAKIFSTNSGVLPTPPYKVNDVWVNATGTWGSGASAVTWSNEILKCITACPENGVASISHWAKASKYTDDSAFNGYIDAILNGSQESGDSYVAAAAQRAIIGALGGATVVDGGLLLTSLIAMRKYNGGDKSQLSSYTTWAGISGMFDAQARGNGIAYWAGGAAADMEDMTAEQKAAWDALTDEQKSASTTWAKRLDRFDGSGYFASNSVKWTADGKVYLANLHTSRGHEISQYFFDAFAIGIDGTTQYINPQYTFNHIDIYRRTGAGAVTLSDNSVLNRGELDARYDARYLKLDFFNAIFQLEDANGTAITPNNATTAKDRLKILVGAYTDQYLSALGLGSDSGGGGSTTLAQLNDVNISNLADGQMLVYDLATTHWVNRNIPETYTLPVATSSALGGIKIGYTTSGKNYAVQLSNQQAYVNVPWENTTYDAATQSADGLMSSTDKTKLDGIAENANNYTLPLAASGTRGGVKIGYTTSGKNYAVQLSSEKMYVNVPWQNDNTWRNIYYDGTQQLGTGTNTKGLNFLADGKTTITFLAAGTGSGQSGSADYATIKISSTWRGIQDNLESDSTTDSLSAAQGKALKGSITALEGYFDDGVANDSAKLNGQSADYYATSSDLSTVQGYFDANGNANAALKLTTVSKTAWGQTYWTANGVPTSISGNMTNVGNISFSATGKNIGSIAYFDTTNTRLGIGTSSPSYKLHVNGTFYASGNSSIGGTFGVTGATTLTGLLTANGGIAIASSKTLKIGDIYLAYDSTNNAIEVYKLDGTNHVAANLYARGGIAALGETSDGGGGGQGDVTWALLASDSDTRQIALSHLTTALSGYSTTSHTHTTTIAAAASGDTSQLTLAHGTKYKLTAGGTSYIFTMPSDNNSWRNVYVAGTEKLTTATNTKAINFVAGNNVSISFAAAGTGSGQSGNANYGTLTISATDTTYTLAGLMGSTAIGGTDQPIYWNGSAFANTSYTVKKSVPADAVFTDHYAWSDITSKPLTLTKNTTGFSISGGTTSKTLTVSENYTLGAACAKGVTDNSSATAVTSTDTNLITARTLYYAGYTKNTGTVTSITLKAGTGISLDTDNTAITTSGTRTISLKSGVCTAGTYKSVTVDTYGRVTAGTNPTTLSGYGITDALSISGGTLTGELRVNMTIQPLLLLQVNGVNKAQFGYHYQDGLIIYNYQAEKGLNISNNGVLSYDGYTIWSSGNDGSGSTLDADLLDGQHGSYYATASSLSNYLPLSGGTLTGLVSSSAEIRATGFRNTTETTFINDSCVFRGASNGQFTRILSDGIGVCDANINGTFVIGYDGTKCYIYQNIGKHICLQASAGSGYTAGNVGIGTNSPSDKLHVSGNTKIEGDLKVNTTLHTTVLLQVNETNKAQFGYHNNYGIFIHNYVSDSGIGINNSGNVIIGNVGGTASYKLHVSGDIYATGGVTSLSDARKKDVQGNLDLNVEQVANAPAIKFLWKDKREIGMQAGTIAQYWQNVLPEVVSDKNDELSMQYGVAALVAAIITAKKVVDHEQRIKQLERENRELRMEVERLKIA